MHANPLRFPFTWATIKRKIRLCVLYMKEESSLFHTFPHKGFIQNQDATMKIPHSSFNVTPAKGKYREGNLYHI